MTGKRKPKARAKPEVPKCGAETKSGGKCGRPAGWGTDHFGAGTCKLHLGNTPTHELAGQLELARRDMLVMGAPLDIEPHQAILQCIRIVAGEVRYASDRIAELEQEDLVGPVKTSTSRSSYGEHGSSYDEERKGKPTVHIWIAVRHQAMDRLVAYSATALRAGVEDALVKIAKQQAELLAQAVRGILADLGQADRPDAPAIVRKHLTLLAGGLAA